MKTVLNIGALALLLSTTLSMTSASAQGTSDAAFERIGTCLEDDGHLLLLAVVDESASLRRTDPDAVRVAALETVVRNIADLGERSSESLSIDFAFGAFSTEYLQITDWSKADASTVDTLIQAARDFAGRNAGIDTDFAAAFTGAAAALDARAQALAAEDNRTACRVLLTFTDGEYDLEARPRETAYAPGIRLDQPGAADQVEQLGREALCEAAGIMDGLYESDTVVLTVGLGSAIDPADQAFLEGLSTGSGCGAAGTSGQGAWVSAADLTGLVFAFDAASIGIAGGQIASDDEVVPCRIDRCASGSVTFDLDETLSRFHLLVSAPQPLAVRMAGPDGREVDLRAAAADVSGAALTFLRLGDVTVVDGELPLPADWAGTWTVTFIDPTGENEGLLARAHVVLFGGLLPRIQEGLEGRVGEEVTVVVDSVGEDGAPRVPDGFLTQINVDLRVFDRLTDEEIAVEPGVPNDGRWPFTLTIPEGTTSTSLDVLATLDATTSSGLELPQGGDRASIAVLPPATFPRIDTAQLAFGSIAGSGTSRASLTLLGGEDPGCVEIGTPTVLGEDIGEVRIDVLDAVGCIEVPAGGEVAVDVLLERTGNQSGEATGSLPVVLRSDVADEVIEQEVPLAAEFLTVIDEALRLELFLIAFAVGLLLPLGILQLLGRWTGRFRRPGQHRVAALDVRVSSGGSIERRDGAGWSPFRLDTDDPQQVDAPSGDPTSFVTHGMTFRVRRSMWPWRAPYGVAAADAPCTGPLGTKSVKGVPAAITPFSLSGHWVFMADPSLEARPGHDDRHGRLLVFLNDVIAFTGVRAQLEKSVLHALPGAAHALPAEAFQTSRPDVEPPDRPEGETSPSTPAGTWQPIGVEYDGSPPSAGNGWRSTYDGQPLEPAPAQKTKRRRRVGRRDPAADPAPEPDPTPQPLSQWTPSGGWGTDDPPAGGR